MACGLLFASLRSSVDSNSYSGYGGGGGGYGGGSYGGSSNYGGGSGGGGSYGGVDVVFRVAECMGQNDHRPKLDGCIMFWIVKRILLCHFWLVVSNMNELFSISYMGCHPSH